MNYKWEIMLTLPDAQYVYDHTDERLVRFNSNKFWVNQSSKSMPYEFAKKLMLGLAERKFAIGELKVNSIQCINEQLIAAKVKPFDKSADLVEWVSKLEFDYTETGIREVNLWVNYRNCQQEVCHFKLDYSGWGSIQEGLEERIEWQLITDYKIWRRVIVRALKGDESGIVPSL